MLGRLAMALAMGGLFGLVAGVRAGSVTPIAPDNGYYSADGPGKTLDYVLGAAYGYSGQGTGTVDTSLTWTGGGNSIMFSRVFDSGGVGDPLKLNGSNATTADDTIWRDGTPTFRVDVRYAAYGQELGWYNNNTSTAQNILTVTGSGLDPTFTYDAGAPPTSLSSSFTWYDITGGNTWYSDPSKNADNGDHMVTYWVTGKDENGVAINGGLGAYVICFEDLPVNISDLDYNDMVVQVSQVVPLPPAAWTGMTTLLAAAGLALIARRRRLA